jgi:hypothetical protein
MSDHVSRLDYCQYLLVSQINYTLTNFADHCERFSHDRIVEHRPQECRGCHTPLAAAHVVRHRHSRSWRSYRHA